MPTVKEIRAQIENIQNKSNNILSHDIEKDLIKREELGNQLNFEELREVFVQIFELTKKVSSYDLTKTPYKNLVNYSNQLETLENIVKNITTFNVNSGNPIQTRNSLIEQLQNALENLILFAIPILTVSLFFSNDLAFEKSKMQSLISEVTEQNEILLKEANELKNELNETLESAKRAAGQVGVAQHSIVFKDEAIFHSDEAKSWMNWTIGILIATALAGFGFLFWMPSADFSNAYIVQFTITKLVVLAVLFYALSICIKNYRAHKHNSIVNKHRQNALSTFETFIKGATDDQTKNAVLLQTTMSIFANQQTGYSTSDNDGDMPSKVIEIIKSSGAAKTS